MNDLDNIINHCEFLLYNYPGAENTLNYLKSRTQSKDFKFGYFPNLEEIQLLTSTIDISILKKLDLFYSYQIEDSISQRNVNIPFFNNYNLIMPFKDQYGKTIALVGRSILSEDERKNLNIPKYKNTSFKKGNYLFGLFENKLNIINKNSVFIVEGQFDVIKATESGFNNVVALGTSNMSLEQFALITRYTNNIFLLLDNDEAGNKGREIILNKYSKFANIKNFFIPNEYKDIDEFLSYNSYHDLDT